MNGNRRFLRLVLESGLELGLITADDVVGHVGPEVLAHHLPVGLKAKLLAAGLAATEMNAKLVVDTLGVEALSEHAPTPSLWSAAEDAMKRSMGADAPVPAAEADAAKGEAAKPEAAKPEAAKAAAAAPSEIERERKSGATKASASDGGEDTREGAAKSSVFDVASGGKNGARKPNRMARPALRGRAGATSRRTEGSDDGNDFDLEVDTKVGAEVPADFEIIDESDVFEEGSTAVRGDLTSPGLRKR